METVLAVQVIRAFGAQVPGREHSGEKIGRVALGGPAGPGFLQELQVIAGVDACNRRHAEIQRLAHFAEALLTHAGQHMVGAGGHLETGLQFAVEHLALGVVQAVVVAVEGEHLVVLAPWDCRHCWPGGGERGTIGMASRG